MSDQLLRQILNELKEIRTEQREMKEEQQAMKEEQQTIKEALELTQQSEAARQSFEQKIGADINTLEYSIEVLNRRQFQTETEIARIKNR